MALDLLAVKVMDLLHLEKKVVIIPVPDLPRFAEKLPFGGSISNTWGLVHGSGVQAAQLIIAEGLLRPADWTYHSNPSQCHMPTFGAFGLGRQLSRDSKDIDSWALKEIFNAALKQGKGQQEILTGAIFKGSRGHTAVKAGGNENTQYLVAHKGAVSTSEKYLLVHSAHTTTRFVTAAWNSWGAYPESCSVHRSPSGTTHADDTHDHTSRSRPELSYETYDDDQPDYSA